MGQPLGPGALGRPRGMGWRVRLERGLGKKKKIREVNSAPISLS